MLKRCAHTQFEQKRTENEHYKLPKIEWLDTFAYEFINIRKRIFLLNISVGSIQGVDPKKFHSLTFFAREREDPRKKSKNQFLCQIAKEPDIAGL